MQTPEVKLHATKVHTGMLNMASFMAALDERHKESPGDCWAMIGAMWAQISEALDAKDGASKLGLSPEEGVRLRFAVAVLGGYFHFHGRIDQMRAATRKIFSKHHAELPEPISDALIAADARMWLKTLDETAQEDDKEEQKEEPRAQS